MATTIDGPDRMHAAPKCAAWSQTPTVMTPHYGWYRHIVNGCVLSLQIQCAAACLCIAAYSTGRLSAWPTIVLVIVLGTSLAPGWILWKMPFTWKALAGSILQCVGIALIFALETYLCVALNLVSYW